MHAPQNVAAAKMLNPPAAASREMASHLFVAPLPIHSSAADVSIPTHTATRRPRFLPILFTAASEKRPPSGASSAIARYGVAPQIPPCEMERPFTRTR